MLMIAAMARNKPLPELPRPPSSMGERIRAARRNAGLTQKDIADRFSIQATAVTQWESNRSVPEPRRMGELASILGVSLDYLVSGKETATVATQDRELEEMLPNAAHPSRIGGRDLPIRGIAQGGANGVLSFSDSVPIDYTARPAALQQVRDAYALWVDGDSMDGFGLPDGTEVHVHPHRTPRAGRFCVVIRTNGDAFIKRFVARRGGKVVVEQSDPRKTLEFPDGEVRAVHRVTSVAYD